MLRTSKKLLTLFRGYSNEERTLLYILNFYLRALELKQVYTIKKNTNMNGFNSLTLEQSNYLRKDLTKECKNFLNYLRRYQTYLAKKLPAESFFKFEVFERNPLAIIDIINSPLFNELEIDLFIPEQVITIISHLKIFNKEIILFLAREHPTIDFRAFGANREF